MFDIRDKQETQKIVDEENRYVTIIQRGAAVYKNRIVVKKPTNRGNRLL